MDTEKLVLIVAILSLVAAGSAVVLCIETVTWPPEIKQTQAEESHLLEDTISGHEYGSQKCMQATEHLWYDVTKAGFNTRILAGRISEVPADPSEINHVWLEVEESPGHWVQVEATVGKVIPEEHVGEWHALLTFQDPEEMWAVYRAGPNSTLLSRAALT